MPATGSHKLLCCSRRDRYREGAPVTAGESDRFSASRREERDFGIAQLQLEHAVAHLDLER